MFRSVLRLQTTLTKLSASVANFHVVVPGKVSPQICVNSLSVPLPPYAVTGIPPESLSPRVPEVKGQEAIEGLRRSCRLAKEILESVEPLVQVGVTTDRIDQFVHNMAIENNAVSLSYLNQDLLVSSIGG